MGQWRHHAVRLSNILRLVFFAYWLFLATHWIACGWLALRQAPVMNNDATNYLNALFWTVQTFSTVGYGNITPVTNAQILYAIAVMIIGVGVYGYIIVT